MNHVTDSNRAESGRSGAETGASAAPIPALEPHCGSWMVTSPAGTVTELFDRSNVERAAQAGYRIETAAKYLARVARIARCPDHHFRAMGLCPFCGESL